MEQILEDGPVEDLPNRNAGQYLRAILLALEGPTDEVRPSSIADRLEVTAASVTEMVHRLESDGYVEHEKYGGISLTREGERLAKHLQWRQCTIRRFFATYFDVEIPDEACYRASFELPTAALGTLRDAVDLDCEDRCDDRIWNAKTSRSAPVREGANP